MDPQDVPAYCARQRVSSVIREIGEFDGLDFPYPDCEAAVSRVLSRFQEWKVRLDPSGPQPSPQIAQLLCARSLDECWEYLPLLGFLRGAATNRNAFEAYSPLWRLATDTLCHAMDAVGSTGSRELHLVMGSEWEYSPLLYQEVPALPDFLLLGLPAHESGNPLLLPLAGHELGHRLWYVLHDVGMTAEWSRRAKEHVRENVRSRWPEFVGKCQLAVDLPVSTLDAGHLEVETRLDIPVGWATDQLEETFCDLVGLRLFGPAFVHAFVRLLSPGLAGPRSPCYPSVRQRAVGLADGLAELVVHAGDTPSPESAFPIHQAPPQDEETRFLVLLADAARDAVTPSVRKTVQDVIPDGGPVPLPDRAGQEAVLQCFRARVPAWDASSLANILNAGWLAALQPDLWPEVDEERRPALLQNLVLKSCEVLEYASRMKAGRHAQG